MDFHPFVSSSKDFTFDFSMSHCYTRYKSEEISPIKGATDRQLRTCMLLYCVTVMHESGQGQLGVSSRQMSVLQNILSGFKDALTAEYSDESFGKKIVPRKYFFTISICKSPQCCFEKKWLGPNPNNCIFVHRCYAIHIVNSHIYIYRSAGAPKMRRLGCITCSHL